MSTLYEQIADYVRDLVVESSPGDRLPSDAELCEKFGVSRMTARQAMQLVAVEGTVERRRGAGTFVKATVVSRELGSPLSFSESMRARGMEASSATLEWGKAKPTDDERHALQLRGGQAAWVLERLRLADGEPMAIERVVMPQTLAQQMPEGFERGSLHAAFRAMGRIPYESHAEISAHKATKRQRNLLGLPPAGIVLSERRTIYDQERVPLERTETFYAASKYSFRAVLRDRR
jgi:GntR family transcriptional regulator